MAALHCTHNTHTQHSNITITLLPVLPTSCIPPRRTARASCSSTLEQQEHVLLTCTAPCGSPPHLALRFPALPCLARFRAPVARAAGPPPTHPEPDQASHHHGLVSASSVPSRAALRYRAREYSRGVRWLGTRVFGSVCMACTR